MGHLSFHVGLEGMEPIQNAAKAARYPIQKRWVLYSLLLVFSLAGYWACSWWSLETRTPPRSVDERAPQFTLLNQNAKPVELASLNSIGPVMLVFYRGHW